MSTLLFCDGCDNRLYDFGGDMADKITTRDVKTQRGKTVRLSLRWEFLNDGSDLCQSCLWDAAKSTFSGNADV
jgi:hypothetical protein